MIRHALMIVAFGPLFCWPNQTIAASEEKTEPQLVTKDYHGHAFMYQPAPPPASGQKGLLVYLHGISVGAPLIPEKDSGMLESLQSWASENGFVLLIPLAPMGKCDGLATERRDLHCWSITDSDREAKRIDRMASFIADKESITGKKYAIGFSRGAYFLSVSWASGQLRKWDGIGLLSGGQSSDNWAQSHSLPPLAIESGRGDTGNLPIISRFTAKAIQTRPASQICQRLTDAGHMPLDGNMHQFLDFVTECASGTSGTGE